MAGLAALIAGGLQTVPASASPVSSTSSSSAHTAALVSASTGTVMSSKGTVARVSGGKAVSVVARWTARSRTSLQADGSYRTTLWPAAVNFHKPGGVWQPIDNALTVGADGVARNTANSWQVSLPKTLVDPVRVSDGAAWVTFSLVGASATSTAMVAGSTATYARVSPGVTAAYTVDNDRVAETLTLADARAASSFRFAVTASPGITITQAADGGLNVKAGGVKVFEMAAPTLADSSHTAAGQSSDATLRAVPAGAGWTVTLAADPAWLGRPAGCGRS